MKIRLFTCALLSAAVLLAQTTPTNSTVSGVVKDRVTGQPLPNYMVSTSVNVTWVGDTVIQSKTTKDVSSTTDASGRYQLADLPPGTYRIQAHDADRFSGAVTRRITTAGADLNGINFLVNIDGSIKGKVLDENKEPVPNLTMSLVSKEYFMGSVGYYVRGHGRTNDLGEYTINGVETGHPYYILAERRDQRLPAFSEVPLDPKLRKRIPMRTFYPNSPDRDSAEAVVLRSGEHREGMDIEIKKSQSYCIDGAIAGPNGSEGLNFSIEPLSPSSGISAGGGSFSVAPGGSAGAGGKFRVCDLYPGSYRFIASERSAKPSEGPVNFATVAVTITDEDQHNLKIPMSGGISLPGEVVLEGPAPSAPFTGKVFVNMQAMMRTQFQNEMTGARADVPGTFALENKLLDDYRVSALLLAPGLYVKDITYADSSVMNEPLRLGSAMTGSGGLRVTIAQDGGTMSVSVTDKDGNPGADMHVLMLPADARTEGAMAARMVQGQTDQTGVYTSQSLRPGKYFVAATEDTYGATVESINQLWRTRNRFTEVDVAPNGTAQVKLVPVKLN
jgi:Carboxypeptidase regulatory-like domain